MLNSGLMGNGLDETISLNDFDSIWEIVSVSSKLNSLAIDTIISLLLIDTLYCKFKCFECRETDPFAVLTNSISKWIKSTLR